MPGTATPSAGRRSSTSISSKTNSEASKSTLVRLREFKHRSRGNPRSVPRPGSRWNHHCGKCAELSAAGPLFPKAIRAPHAWTREFSRERPFQAQRGGAGRQDHLRGSTAQMRRRSVRERLRGFRFSGSKELYIDIARIGRNRRPALTLIPNLTGCWLSFEPSRAVPPPITNSYSRSRRGVAPMLSMPPAEAGSDGDPLENSV
jgi:hypothetical protein